MSYKVTVITPVYNAEKYLNRTINSIINQTFGFENIEYILVDDKSTDSSREIIKKYQEKYDNIKGIFLEENTGFPGGPRNIAIQNSTTDYLVFLDNDDYYLPEAIEIYYNTIENEGSDLVMSSHYHGRGDNLRKINYIDTDKKIVNFNPTGSQESFDFLSFSHIAPWAKIWRKKFIIEHDIHFLDDCLCEDTFFYYNALIHADKVSILPNDVCYVYSILEDSTIHGHTFKMFNNYFTGVKRTVDVLMDIDLSKRAMLSETMCAVLLIFSNLNNEDKKTAANDIYNFETNLNHEIVIDNIEINFLNNLIKNKHFTLASKLANLYRFLYDNPKIYKIYSHYNNRKDNKKID